MASAKKPSAARRPRRISDPLGEMIAACIAADTDRLIESFTGNRNAQAETTD